MKEIRVTIKEVEYHKAILAKGGRTWRAVLLTALGVAHDHRPLGRPRKNDVKNSDGRSKGRSHQS